MSLKIPPRPARLALREKPHALFAGVNHPHEFWRSLIPELAAHTDGHYSAPSLWRTFGFDAYGGEFDHAIPSNGEFLENLAQKGQWYDLAFGSLFETLKKGVAAGNAAPLEWVGRAVATLLSLVRPNGFMAVHLNEKQLDIAHLTLARRLRPMQIVPHKGNYIVCGLKAPHALLLSSVDGRGTIDECGALDRLDDLINERSWDYPELEEQIAGTHGENLPRDWRPFLSTEAWLASCQQPAHPLSSFEGEARGVSALSRIPYSPTLAEVSKILASGRIADVAKGKDGEVVLVQGFETAERTVMEDEEDGEIVRLSTTINHTLAVGLVLEAPAGCRWVEGDFIQSQFG